ncbi:cation diffusion facilitator family transporter [Acaryochloris marina]|uniref:Cation diffusion facilitator family transporter, putative n=1 Tax=Acaryochloris marina (strain MBIC 11017) TaxID=329726 RepID=B0C608_ACAM1|nr:cation transporter [Acaryochloris marina]ABW31125.1 cation diffusion facilitator family transporter, putative [Acaryochloris marina MBIC11017]BDM79827.1 cation transporter [Acaryochloris marina MBIC10699]
MSRNITIEEQGIRLSILGNLFMAALGLCFASLSHSEMILLDGVFSLINLVIAYLSLKILRRSKQSNDYYNSIPSIYFEPLINLVKGVILTIVCLLAFGSSVIIILNGGHAISTGKAIWYALLATLVCMTIALKQRKRAKACNSSLIEVDAKSWFIDGLLSGVVVLVFTIVFFLQNTTLAIFLPYADPILVIFLCLIVAPIPVEIVKENWPKLVGEKYDVQLEYKIIDIIDKHIPKTTIQDYYVSHGYLGDKLYVQCHLLVIEEISQKLSLAEQDKIRAFLYQKLRDDFPSLAIDINFICDPIWVERRILHVSKA